jgi:hypothetical protein
LLKETKLNEHTEALARANADIATVPTHVRVFTISLKRSTQNLQLSICWAGRLPVCTENLIRVDVVMESPKLAE